MDKHIEYVESKVAEYTSKLQDKLYVEVATCDGRNWDTTLHHLFPLIVKRLKENGMSVTSSVNYEVTDWVITKA